MRVYLLRANSVFLLGFSLGFLAALFTIFIESKYISIIYKVHQSWKEKPGVEPKILHGLNIDNRNQDIWFTYDIWLQSKNRQRFPENLDKFLYGPVNKNKLSEADWLRLRVHITCVVFVEKVQLALATKATWSQRCNRVYFIAHRLTDPDIPIIKFPTKITSSWQLFCETIYFVNFTEPIEWVIFVKDDTIVLPENLRFLVAPLDHKKGYYLGHAISLWGQAYNVAQAGYVLSYGALTKILEMFDNPQKCASGGKYWKKEDYYLGKHLASVGIYPLDTRDSQDRWIFHGYSIQAVLRGISKTGNYWTHALYPFREDCCSPRSITFGAGESDKMYTWHYILYVLKVLRTPKFYGNEPAPTSIPDNQVWRKVLETEFNLTGILEMSNQQYYDIWREKYSEPEKFIMNNCKNQPDVLNFLLTAYTSQKKQYNQDTVTSQ